MTDEQLIAALRNEMQCEPVLGDAAAARIRALIAERDEALDGADWHAERHAENVIRAEAAEADVARLIAERDALNTECNKWEDSNEELWFRAEKAEAEVARLIAERDAMTDKYNRAFWRAENATAEVARLRAAVYAFLTYTDQCPQRAAYGAGGQTMENVVKGTIVSVSLWEIEGLRAALATEHTP